MSSTSGAGGSRFDVVCAIIAVLAAGSSAWSAIQANQMAAASIDAAGRQAEVSIFLDFKNRYHQIRSQIPRQHERPSKFDNTVLQHHWGAFDAYWQNAFDEWFATHELKLGRTNALWDKFYAPAIRAAAQESYYQESLCFLVHGGSSFSGRSEEFRKAVISLFSPSEVPECLRLDAASFKKLYNHIQPQRAPVADAS